MVVFLIENIIKEKLAQFKVRPLTKPGKGQI